MAGIRTRVVAIMAGLGAAALANGAAAACGGGVALSSDPLAPGYALARAAAGGGVEVVVNEERAGVGLGRQTKDWLIARQCFLAQSAGASPAAGAGGYIEFAPSLHEQADCHAYRTVVEGASNPRIALKVIDRDVSPKARGDYWDDGMGRGRRNISSDVCLN